MPLRILVAYSMSSSYVQTTLDYVLALKRYSDLEVSYIHVTHKAIVDFDINCFDVVFHSYCARLCFGGYVSESYREAMRHFRGLKILAVQDEYNHTNVLKAAIRELGFHVVLTCVPQQSLEYVYPRHEFPDIEFITVLTGYVPDDIVAEQRPSIPLGQRPIVVGYRGRDIGAFYGRLAFEKYEIGRRMREICLARDIPHDIAMDEESRIYGPAWFDFIGSCRSMLGSESGSNVFDFDGSVEGLYRKMAAARGGKVSYEEFLPIVAQRDAEISMGQISPRVFECAAMKTPMVLYRGRYSDAIEADEHYISLEKDFSNIDEVIGRLEDIPALEVLAERTYDHLVGSGRFGYRAYGRFLRTLIERKFDELGLLSGTASVVWETSSWARPRDMFCQLPTDQPLGKVHFEIMQHQGLISVLESEVKRLSDVFEQADADYLCEVARLSGVYEQRIAHVLGKDATAILSPECPPLAATRSHLLDFAAQCQKRRGQFTSEWSELGARLVGSVDVEPAEPGLLEIHQARVSLLESEIKILNNEIDKLNAVGWETVTAVHGATMNALICLFCSPHVTFWAKMRILARLLAVSARRLVVSVRLLAARVRHLAARARHSVIRALPRVRRLILSIAYFRRVIEAVRSRRT